MNLDQKQTKNLSKKNQQKMKSNKQEKAVDAVKSVLEQLVRMCAEAYEEENPDAGFADYLTEFLQDNANAIYNCATIDSE